MIELWPHWQRPFFIILLPIIVYLLWKLWQSNIHKGSWQNIIPTVFQPWLLRGTAGKTSNFPKLLITIASLFAMLALLGPSWKHIQQPPLKLEAPLVIVVDMTPRMLANDISPNRLESVKRKLLDIISVRKDAQTAIIVYAGSAHVVAPLSDDKDALDNLIKVLSPSIMPKFGENAETGIAKAIKLIDNSRQQDKTKRAEILLVTTGINEDEQNNIKKLLAGQSINLDILGVGTAQGAPLVVDGQFLKDQAGNVISSKLDSTSLQQLAYSEGGYYSTMSLNNADIEALHLANPTGNKRLVDEKEMRTTNIWQDQGYWFILPILLLTAFAGRKGWLFCIPLFAFTFQPQTAHAFEWNQLWLNKNQQGQQLLKENKPEEAAKKFQDKQWQSYAAYQAKDYANAEKALANAKTPESIYNYGNALARQGKYQEAIAAWDKAIKEKPNFEQAIVNKKIVEDMLKKQQQDPQQDQNQDQQQNQNGNQQDQQQQKNDSSSQDSDQQKSNNQQQDQQQNPEQSNNSQQSNNEQQQQNDKQGQSGSENNQDQKNAQSSPNDDKQKDNDQEAPLNEQSSSAKEENQAQKGEQQAKSAQAKQQEANPSSSDKMDGAINDIDTAKQEQEEELKRRLPESEDPSELLRRKFYFEQRYNKGDY